MTRHLPKLIVLLTFLAAAVVGAFAFSAPADGALILNVQPTGTPRVPLVVAPGTTLTLTITAAIDGTAAALQDVFYGVWNSAGVGTLSTVDPVYPFGAAFAQPGVTAGGSVGLGVDSGAAGWVFARSPVMTPGAALVIGTLTFTAGNVPGTTSLLVIPRHAYAGTVPAVWSADGVVSDAAASTGNLLTLTVAVPEPAGVVLGLVAWGMGRRKR